MSLKKHVFETISKIGKGLSCGKRLEILDLLCQGELSVDKIAAKANISQKLASAHLRALREARLVVTRRDSRHIFYRLADESMPAALVAIARLAERRFTDVIQPLSSHFDDLKSMCRLDQRELIQKSRSGEIVVIDVRPEDEFQAGHFPEARSIPIDNLKQRLSRLPKNREIVAYCRGSYCVYAHQAVKLLQREGYKASWYPEGITEWRSLGLSLAEANYEHI